MKKVKMRVSMFVELTVDETTMSNNINPIMRPDSDYTDVKDFVYDVMNECFEFRSPYDIEGLEVDYYGEFRVEAYDKDLDPMD